MQSGGIIKLFGTEIKFPSWTGKPAKTGMTRIWFRTNLVDPGQPNSIKIDGEIKEAELKTTNLQIEIDLTEEDWKKLVELGSPERFK